MLRYLSLFSGIGAFEKALSNMGEFFDLVGYCEIDRYASKSYSLIHGISEDKNLWDVTKIDTYKLEDFDLMTWGFPCQDISVAGKGAGIKEGTRSGLYYEGYRILKAKLPKYSIIENVKALVCKKHKESFEMILKDLEELGYTNYWKVLNAKDYGIPQNRERVFIISIRGEHEPFEFPTPFDNGVRLKDLLEDEVDEKYYISNDKTNKLIESLKDKQILKGGIIEVIGNYMPSNHDASRVVNIDGIAPTVKENHGTITGVAIPNKLIQVGELDIKDNERQRRVYSPNGSSPSVLARQDSAKILEVGKLDMRGSEQVRRVYSSDGLCPTIDTMQGGHRQPKVVSDYRIRKLTPKECWRLMGFDDLDIDKCIEEGISNTQAYKQAGNSIVVKVLEEILKGGVSLFKELFSKKQEDKLQGLAAGTPNNDIEQKMANKISNDIECAESAKGTSLDDLGWTIEETWKDEEKIYKGGGLQWVTEFAFRSRRMRKIRPCSEDNFVFNALQIQAANITSTIPEVKITGTKNEHEIQAHKVQCASRYNDEKNNFKLLWRRTVLDFLKYGPAIMKVDWDSSIYGGKGPDRWIGDVRLESIRKEDFFPDPAILDLELNIDECSYVVQRYRKKVSYVRDRWKKYGKHIVSDMNEDQDQDEGFNQDMVYVYEYWHRGFPEYMPSDRKKELEGRAIELEERGRIYKAKDVMDMSRSEIEGIHVAYYCNDVLLEYVPYVYDHGLYPYSFSTRYDNEVNHWGFGEIRNIKIPQVLHNKADEVEMEAMARQGLGGSLYRRGSISPKQLDKIKEDNGKGGMYFEVNDTNGIQPREGVQVPASITNYKEHKQRMVETVSQVTAIQQGQNPATNTPYKAIAELGARGDVRMRAAAEKLEYFLIKVNRIRIALFEQFYTEERYYRVKGKDSRIVEDGNFSNEMMYDVWQRETVIDEEGNQINLEEHFVPDFDISIDIISKKPTDRNYYANIAFTMHDRGAITKEDLWKTIDEGRLPDLDLVMQHLNAQDQMQGLIQQLGELPPEIQQDLMQQQIAQLQEVVMETQRLLAEQQMAEKGKGEGGGVKNAQNQFNKPQQQPKPGAYSDNLDFSGGLVGGQNFDTIVGR